MRKRVEDAAKAGIEAQKEAEAARQRGEPTPTGVKARLRAKVDAATDKVVAASKAGIDTGMSGTTIALLAVGGLALAYVLFKKR
jgi:hypothetical protein